MEKMTKPQEGNQRSEWTSRSHVRSLTQSAVIPNIPMMEVCLEPRYAVEIQGTSLSFVQILQPPSGERTIRIRGSAANTGRQLLQTISKCSNEAGFWLAVGLIIHRLGLAGIWNEIYWFIFIPCLVSRNSRTPRYCRGAHAISSFPVISS